MRFTKTLITDTKGSSIFKLVKSYYEEKEILLTNVKACATDGSPAMSGRHTGLLAHLKKEVPEVITIHCVIHRQHLAAKKLSGALYDTLKFFISGISKIKANSLNDRLFRELCRENDEDFELLLLHTDMRWPSKGNCSRRFFELFDSVTEFLDTTNSVLRESLKQRKLETAYLTDIFEEMNEINVKLQGNKMKIIKAKGIISSLIAKFDIYKSKIGCKELMRFPTLKKCSMADIEILENKILIFTDHIDQLKTDMESRFKDLMKL
nr:protein ZBED8-like [Parasteatoda tepidariorum]